MFFKQKVLEFSEINFGYSGKKIIFSNLSESNLKQMTTESIDRYITSVLIMLMD
jgi:hypothetical protein